MVTVLFTKDGSARVDERRHAPIVFTRDYVKHSLFSKKTSTQGTSGLVTRIHKFLDVITHVDVHLQDGEFVREVPIDYFRA